MKQHTPHPWKIVPCSNPHEAFAIEANGKTICWVANTYDEKRDREVITAEDRANARLLMVAPDLLSALEMAEKSINWLLEEEGEVDLEALRRVRQAMVKAKRKAYGR